MTLDLDEKPKPRAKQLHEPSPKSEGMAPPCPLQDIEWRVDSQPYPSKSGSGHVARYVPYLNSAICAQLLDEWAGPGNWSDRYEPGELNGRPVLWCRITVRFPWGDISKVDVGVPPRGDDADLSDKGLVSDAFKRCATLKWGVGRNVYRLPVLWAACDEVNGKARAPRGIEHELTKQLLDLGWKPDGSR